MGTVGGAHKGAAGAGLKEAASHEKNHGGVGCFPEVRGVKNRWKSEDWSNARVHPQHVWWPYSMGSAILHEKCY